MLCSFVVEIQVRGVYVFLLFLGFSCVIVALVKFIPWKLLMSDLHIRVESKCPVF